MRKWASVIAFAMSLVACAPNADLWHNREVGEGWRLVATGTFGADGRAYQVRAATTDAEWHILWRIFDTTNPPPSVDWATEIAASFSEGIGSSCRERRLDDVVIDPAERLVYSVTSDPLEHRGCTDDLVGVVVFVVALERNAMPAGPFTVRLRQTCAGPCNDGEEVTVSLEP